VRVISPSRFSCSSVITRRASSLFFVGLALCGETKCLGS
jgi:hypothetical protein